MKSVFLLSLQVPCSLEYWDELQQTFVLYQEFSLSESSACQLQLPSLSLTDQQKELVASDLWRIVLNTNGEGGDEQRWGKILYPMLWIWPINKSTVHVDRVCVWSPVWGNRERESAPGAAEHKELAMCPSPHIWCAEAGSGLGKHSDRPNEISQHTKCLSGPIRIPSCLPWVYLIEGKLTGNRRSKAPIGSDQTFFGLCWVGLSGVWKGWVGLGQLCNTSVSMLLLPSSHYHCFLSSSFSCLTRDFVTSSVHFPHFSFLSVFFLIPSSS